MTQRLLVSTRKGLFEWEARDGQWQLAATSFLGEPVTLVLPDPRDGATYAALNLGHFGVKLHRRAAGAAAFTEIAAPAYPPQPETDFGPFPWKLKLVWSLEAGGTGQPGTLWAGTLPGGLFRSDDRGESWRLQRALWDLPDRNEWFGGGYDEPGIHSICVDPRDADRVLVALSSGGAWSTRDGGATWSARSTGMRADYMPPEKAYDLNAQDPHRIVRCPSAPDVLWCQHHGGIWRSTDDGAQWTEVIRDTPGATSTFGFAVGVHPHDPDTAWFVPAIADQRRIPVDHALSVARTRDGGRSFEQLRDGLPQRNCFDLVYRHGLAVADDGCTLAIGSTTGGLWVSHDSGDHWQAIDASLPPITAVRFA